MSAIPSEWEGFWTPFEWNDGEKYLREFPNLDIIRSSNPKKEFFKDYDFLTGKTIQVQCVAGCARGGEGIEPWALKELLRSKKCLPKTFGDRKIAIEYVEGSMTEFSRCENSTIDENDPEYQNLVQLWYFKFDCKWTLLEPFTLPDDAKNEPSSFKNILKSYSLEDVCQAVYNYFETGVKPVVVNDEIKKDYLDLGTELREKLMTVYKSQYEEKHRRNEDDVRSQKMMEQFVFLWSFSFSKRDGNMTMDQVGPWDDQSSKIPSLRLFESLEPKKDLPLVYEFLSGKRVRIPGSQLTSNGIPYCVTNFRNNNMDELEEDREILHGLLRRKNRFTGTFAHRKIAIEFIEDSLEIAPRGCKYSPTFDFYATLLEPFSLSNEAKRNPTAFHNELKYGFKAEEYCQAVYDYFETGVKPTILSKETMPEYMMHCENLEIDINLLKMIVEKNELADMINLPSVSPYEECPARILIGREKVEFEVGHYSSLKDNHFTDDENAIDVCGNLFRELKAIVENRKFASVSCMVLRKMVMHAIEDDCAKEGQFSNLARHKNDVIAQYARLCIEANGERFIDIAEPPF